MKGIQNLFLVVFSVSFSILFGTLGLNRNEAKFCNRCTDPSALIFRALALMNKTMEPPYLLPEGIRTMNPHNSSFRKGVLSLH